jgi:nitrous oxidase accessory protein
MKPKGLSILLPLCFLCLMWSNVAADDQVISIAQDLQDIVDKAEEGAVIMLSPAVYSGPVVINKPLTIDGNGQATLDGQKTGTAITIKANGVKIINMKIINTGDRHDLIDAGIALIDSSHCEVINNRIERCLFGLNLQNSHNNLIKDNEISSMPYGLGLRGDGLWIYWSDNNNITGNRISDVRDVVVWYSMGNNIENNTVTNSRYSIHFMFSDLNHVKNNIFKNNSVGIYNMYSNGIFIEGNTITASLGATGMGIGLKEASDTICKNNRIIYCSRGIAVDQSPFEPDSSNYFINNELVFNNEAVSFVTDGTRINNYFKGNTFKWNIQDVTVSGTRGVAKGFWQNNYWDNYEGFDQNRDGIGDTPYRYYIYADQLWINNPALQFFRGSVVLTFLDFLQRLAPFSPPEFALSDEEPLWRSLEYRWEDEATVEREVTARIASGRLLEKRRGKSEEISLPFSDRASHM